ncbi:MAG TPA: flagellar motor protein MotB [Chloroflexota bacterium]|nr:flagellar motor protein MotB [Chloroflexota bacterium]
MPIIEATPRAQKDRSERWLLTYADLITLLMVFFVILFSFSIIDVKRFEDLKGSLDKAFSQGVLAGINTTSLSQSVAYGTVNQRIASEDQDARASVASQLQKVADATGAGDSISVIEVLQGVTISLPAELLFQSGTADLKPGATQLLGQVAEPLKDLSNPIQVVSNTDELQPQDSNSKFKDNWQLGDARSYTVLRALVDGDQFPEDRLSLWNKAQYSPLFPNDTPENRAKNRRVDLLVVFATKADASNASGPAFQVSAQASAQARAASP